MPVRSISLSATLAGAAINDVLSARCSFGMDQLVAEASLVCATKPAGVNYDQEVIITMGAGVNNVQRFKGKVRELNYDLYPRAVALVCKGELNKAAEYENWEDAGGGGGLLISDLTGSALATDQAIVRAVLTKAGVPYSDANVGGTGVQFGAASPSGRDLGEQFMWGNGTSPDLEASGLQIGAGESALSYIQRFDAVSAVYDAASAGGGFYRTFESLSGTVYRTLVGGRPRSTQQFTFEEGVDIFEANSQRERYLSNYFIVSGYDDGLGLGGEYFSVSSSQAETDGKRPYAFSSPFIQRSNISDAGTGMAAETVANALLLDNLRETVRLTMTTPRDDLIGPGQTHLVQAAGGSSDRLGIGEKLWVIRVDVQIDNRGNFSQTMEYLGGGAPDAYLPVVGT